MYRTYLPTGLKNLWPLNEGNGLDRDDILNPGLNVLAQTGGVTQVAGPSALLPFGTGVVGATPQYLNLLNTAFFDPTKPFSFSLWFKIASGHPLQSILGLWPNGGGNAVLSVTDGFPGGVGPAIHYVPNPLNGADSCKVQGQIADLAYDAWHLLVLSSDQNVLTAFLDGPNPWLVAGVPPDMGSGPYGFGPGVNASGAGGATGSFCQLCYWQRPLSGGDIFALFGGGQGLPYPF